MNFRDTILHAVRDRLYELEIHNLNSPINGTTRFNSIKFDDAVRDIQDYSSEEDRKKKAGIREPNMDYSTPTWQTIIRPLTPQDVLQQHLAPSVFINVRSGQRSASGRGRGRQNVSAIGVLGDMTEDYGLDIQGVFCAGIGAVADAGIPRSDWKAKHLSEQINGFVHDLDKLLNANSLRPMLQRDDVTIVDAYIMDWQALQAFEGKPDQVVVARLNVTVNFARNENYDFRMVNP